jgi:Predicted transcriptional regulators
MNKKIIGKRLRQQREDLQYTREKFAEIVGISAPFLAEVESGRKGMSAETLCKICTNLPISANYILLGKDDFNKSGNSAIKMIEKIPTKYHSIIEEFLKLFNETISM